MSKTREQKQEQIKALEENLEKQKGLVLLDYSGVSSADLFDLRNKLKNENCRLKVSKKTLLEKALNKLGKKELIDKVKQVKAQLALVFGFDDPIMPSKFCWQAFQNNENFKILGGLIDSRFVEQDKIIELAQLPSRQELLAKLVGSLKSPIANFNNVLKANLNSLVYILSQRSKNN